MANRQTHDLSPSPVEGMMHVMRSILLQLSGLAGILAFLTQMWSRSPLDQSLYTGVIVGGGVYIILLLVDVVTQRIVAAHVESAREEARARARGDANKDDDKENTPVTARERATTNSTDTSDTDKNSSGQEDSAPALTGESSANSASADEEMAAV